MSADETNEFSTNESTEPSESSTEFDAEPTPKPAWTRRTFLKAAAIGAAAATLINKGESGSGLAGWHLGAAAALARDYSDQSCTAEDIDVLNGVVVNAPCTENSCTNGTFCALVRFRVRNRTATGRYCITLHLPGVAEPVLLKTDYAHPVGSCTPTLTNGCPTLSGTSTIEGKSGGNTFNEISMYGVIPNFPCSTDQVCYGSEVPEGFQGSCTRAGIAPCPTIAFETSPGEAGCTSGTVKFPGGQCRHKTICVQGFGIDVECSTSGCPTITPATSDNASACNVKCGEDLYIAATASGGTGTFAANCTFQPCTTAPAITLQTPASYTGTPVLISNTTGTTSTGAPSRTVCYKIPSATSGNYTLTATDCTNTCTRTGTVSVTATELTTPTLSVVSSNPCTGSTTFQVTPCPAETGVTYSFTYCDGTPITPAPTLNSSCQFTLQLPQGQTTCIKVTASNGDPNCAKTDTESVTVPPQLTIGPPTRTTNPCTGLAEFEATAQGGTAPYQYSFNGGAFGSSNKFTVAPTLLPTGGLDTSCKTLTVTVKDANECSASSSTTYRQCIDTPTGC